MSNVVAAELGRIPMSPNLAATLSRATEYARAQSHVEVTLEHLLLALTEDAEAAMVLAASHVDLPRLNTDISSHLGRIEERTAPGQAHHLVVSFDLRRILEAAAAAAQQGRRREINGAIVLAAVVGDGKSTAAHLLSAHGMTFEGAIRALQKANAASAAPQPAAAQNPAPPPAQGPEPSPRPATHPSSAPIAMPEHDPVTGGRGAGTAPSPKMDDLLAAAREKVRTRNAQPSPAPPSPAPAAPALGPPLQSPDSAVDGFEPAAEVPVRTQGERTDRRTFEPDWTVASESGGPPPSAQPSSFSEPASPPDPGARLEPSIAHQAGPVTPSAYPVPPVMTPPPPVPAPSPAVRPPQGSPTAPPGLAYPTGMRPANAAAATAAAAAQAQPARPQSWAPPPQPPPGPQGQAGPPPARPSLRQPPPLPPPQPFPGAAGTSPYGAAPQPGGPPPPPPWSQGAGAGNGAPGSPPQRGPAPDLVQEPRPEFHPEARFDPRSDPGTRGRAAPRGAHPTSEEVAQDLRRVASPPMGRPGPAQHASPAPHVEIGQLVENIPKIMRVAVPQRVEVRIGKADVKSIAEGLQGGGTAWRHEVTVTKAMSVRLRAPDGGFYIESASPETQWIEPTLGLMADEFASWRWTVTPRARGTRPLQLVVSARTVGADGLAAETALPDQVIDVKVRINYSETAKSAGWWIAAAIVGGLLAKFGEGAFAAAVAAAIKAASGS